MARWFSGSWLGESRRSGLAIVVCLVVSIALAFLWPALEARAARTLDNASLTLAAYLVTYLGATLVAFSRASPDAIRAWAQAQGRGSWVQRYVLGTAPGPGVSISVSTIALAVVVYWLPRGGAGGSGLGDELRLVVGVVVIVVSWVTVLVSFAVAYHADDVVEGGRGLRFPGEAQAVWTDYVYFAAAVSTTFGTTDVSVESRAMRRTVTAHAVIAFVFNTVILGTVVGVLAT